MAEAKRRAAWQHTASLMALLANCHRDPKQRSQPYRPSDFDPFAERVPDQVVTLTPKHFIASLAQQWGAKTVKQEPAPLEA